MYLSDYDTYFNTCGNTVKTNTHIETLVIFKCKRLASKGTNLQTVHPCVQRRAMLMVRAGYRKISVLAHKIRGFLNIQKK